MNKPKPEHIGTKQQSKIKKFKKPLFIASIALNALFVLYIIAVEIVLPPILEDKLFYAQLSASQQYYCTDKYDYALQRVGSDGVSDQAEERKFVYALTVCLKNYKTGQPLDLKPLIEQVNKTLPETDFK